MQMWIAYTTRAIRTERLRGAAPDTIPAEDLSVALNMLCERVMTATFTAEESAIPEDRVIDTLTHVWLASIYDVRRWPPHVRPADPTAAGHRR
jgi:TetR/AcrR family transcriptional regulator, ethionamide resistance regulator